MRKTPEKKISLHCLLSLFLVLQKGGRKGWRVKGGREAKLCNKGGHTFEVCDTRDMCDQCIELVHGVLIFISLSVASHADTERNVPTNTKGNRKAIVYLLLRTPHLIPFSQTALFSFVSILTSGVFICFTANFLIALIAMGARFLKPLQRVLFN